MLVLDLGDRIVMRPLPDDPLGEIRGKYRGRGPSTDEARREARAEEAEAEARRSRQ
jgi:hypothetical protein